MVRISTGGLAVLVFVLGAVAHEGAFGPMPQPPRLAQADAPSAAPVQESCALTLRLVDSATGLVRAGVVHLQNGRGETLRPVELLPRTFSLSEGSLGEAAYGYMHRWCMLPAERTIPVPRGPLTITAFSGLDTRMATAEIDLSGKAQATITVRLAPLGTALGAPERTGNVHLHLKNMELHEAERYATEAAMADGLDVVFLSYLERTGADEGYISNTFTGEDLRRFHERSGVLFGYGEEYRHNFPRQEGYGHVMFLDLPELILPASFGPDIMKRGNDDGTLRPGILQAREQKATVLWCHNARGHEDIPSWIAGLIDGQIIFDSGAQGGYEHGFYRYLNIGLKVPVSMGTDWSYNDMAMTVVALDGELSTEAWLAALRAGRSYITNGPLLEFSVNGASAGATLSVAPGTELVVRARAVCRTDFKGLDLVVNGEVAEAVRTQSTGGGFMAEMETTVTVEQSAWLAVRAVPFGGSYDRPETGEVGFNEYGKPLFAHTSPVYVAVGGESVFIPDAADSLIAELRSSMVTIRHTGTYTNEEERDRVLAVYQEAIGTLRARLDR